MANKKIPFKYARPVEEWLQEKGNFLLFKLFVFFILIYIYRFYNFSLVKFTYL